MLQRLWRCLSLISTRSIQRMPEYAGKLCLAPMVRSGELPTRLMALKFGADLVWSPEIIDKKIRTCSRVENKELETIDFIETGKNGSKNSLIFRTNRKYEEGKLIFQLGSADPDIAVEGALKVIQDVDGIDLNCGCPKPFSTHAGMGAALLSNPDLLCLILENLVEKVGKPYRKPISAKIRLLDSKSAEPSLALIDRLCSTGITNLTVHCRTREMRNRESPVRDYVSQIYDLTNKRGVSLVINGAFRCRKEAEQFKQFMGNDQIGIMMAEAAESNPSVFSKDPLAWKEVLVEFVKTCISCDNHPSNTKYILLNQLPGKSKYYQQLCKLKKNEDFLNLVESIEDDGTKIFIRVMQKDRLYDKEELETIFGPKKRTLITPPQEEVMIHKKKRAECA